MAREFDRQVADFQVQGKSKTIPRSSAHPRRYDLGNSAWNLTRFFVLRIASKNWKSDILT